MAVKVPLLPELELALAPDEQHCVVGGVPASMRQSPPGSGMITPFRERNFPPAELVAPSGDKYLPDE